jgi:hypothetical protein
MGTPLVRRCLIKEDVSHAKKKTKVLGWDDGFVIWLRVCAALFTNVDSDEPKPACNGAHSGIEQEGDESILLLLHDTAPLMVGGISLKDMIFTRIAKLKARD